MTWWYNCCNKWSAIINVMKKIYLAFLLNVAAMATAVGQSSPLTVHELRLSNGMQVWLNEDHSQPKVYGAVVIRAGAKDSPNTGLAHYLEHLLFKGTEELGTVDYAKEKIYLDSIALYYNKLSEATDEEQRGVIQKEINRLSLAAAEFAIPNEFDKLITKYGGTKLNAATSYDYTYYHNTFSPQYLRQWAELNSHRLINPVFRMFQSELETVYEEKNRAADDPMRATLDEAIKLFCGEDSPYSYPIIGSTENLKNPRLGQMKDFFDKYYVGANMGLILCGDFQTEGIVPLLEQTFGKIPKGSVPEKVKVEPPKLDGTKSVKIKAKIPIVKVSGYAFSGPVDKDPDAVALSLATELLSNNFTSGLLDSLSIEHKLLAAAASRISYFNEVGAVGYAVIPSLIFGSRSKAEKICAEQIEKIKRGEFSDKTLESLKLDAYSRTVRSLETIDERSGVMLSVMTQDRSWNDYLLELEKLKNITRQDVIAAANKYFNNNNIYFRKVWGSYPKDKIAKPDFASIKPKNTDAKSEFARKLEKIPVEKKAPRLLDFENDIQRTELNSNVTLYYKNNSVNDLFRFTVKVGEGDCKDSALPYAASFANQLGTDSLSRIQLSKAWQELGGHYYFNTSNNTVTMYLSGYDKNFEPSLRLLTHVIENLKPDEKTFKELKQSLKVEKKSFFVSGTSAIMQAAMHRTIFGLNSKYLRNLSAGELQNVGMEGLLSKLKELQNKRCAIFYFGSLPQDRVVATIKSIFDIDRKTAATERIYYPFEQYSQPTVFFYNLPGSRQTQIMSYQAFPAPSTPKEKTQLKLLGEYVGGGMYSLMFQEVREFRSLSYSAGGGVLTQVPVNPDKTAIFYTMLGTQADKSLSALKLVDSLLRDMPMQDSRFEATVSSLEAKMNNGFPAQREIGEIIHDYRTVGYTEDPDKPIYENLHSISIDELKNYYNSNVRNATRSYVIVGDKKKLPMSEFAKFGKIVELSKDDIYK